MNGFSTENVWGEDTTVVPMIFGSFAEAEPPVNLTTRWSPSSPASDPLIVITFFS